VRLVSESLHKLRFIIGRFLSHFMAEQQHRIEQKLDCKIHHAGKKGRDPRIIEENLRSH